GGGKPGGDRPGAGQRPPGMGKPGSNRPGGGANVGGDVNIGNTVNIGNRPGRPPGARPPALHRPPNWHRPAPRPPGWRPRPYPPPYVRPPSAYWGPYYYNPGWGWFFTGAIAGATLAYVVDLPKDEDECDRVKDGDDTLYVCDGVAYRSTYYKDEKVYEIVSEEDEAPPPEPKSVVGLELTTPLTKGGVVKALQSRLIEVGYDVGAVDGVYGDGTRTAVEWFQYDNDLEVTGAVDQATADKLGL
ncbi:MAG: peptidoglycan-binding domain-containing protein, partial [Pseudomonadota bacterium]|nr:peptidoglycan-binding domain-containing protein [Pseudomonadota bacterium]